MALKLNIRPEIEHEMNKLLALIHIKSKTEYINRAIAHYNHQMRRSMVLSELKDYFGKYAKEAKKLMAEFSQIRKYEH